MDWKTKTALDWINSQRPFTTEWRIEMANKYPFLKGYDIYGDGESIEPSEWIWLDDMPEGWVIRFGDEMCAELYEILKNHDYLDEYEIVQVKEKFGTLRWYDNHKYDWEDYRAWEDKYEKLSYQTCVKCGEPATVVSQGWLSSWCDECAKNVHDNFLPIKQLGE